MGKEAQHVIDRGCNASEALWAPRPNAGAHQVSRSNSVGSQPGFQGQIEIRRVHSKKEMRRMSGPSLGQRSTQAKEARKALDNLHVASDCKLFGRRPTVHAQRRKWWTSDALHLKFRYG
jgi:hypothetical protein